VASTRPTAKRRVVFIDIARAVAALLVLHSHLVATWTSQYAVSSPVFATVNTLFADPLHVGKQGLGQLSVPMFFLISGFVVPPLAIRQGAWKFAVSRALRVYPSLIVVVLLTGLAISVGLHPLSTGQDSTVTPLTLLTNATLASYLIIPQVVLVGVAWTLIIEVLFYALTIAVLPVLRRKVWLAIAIELTFVQVVLMTARAFNANYLLFAVAVSYMPVIIIGQVIWAAQTKRIPLWSAGVLITVSWSLYAWAGVRDMGRLDDGYDSSMAFALLLFLLGLFAESKLRERAVWTWLSERTFSLYLWHSLVGFLVLNLVYPYVGAEIGVVLAVAVTFGVVEISYRLVERPSHLLGRRLSRPKDREAPVRDIPAEITTEITTRIPRIVADPPPHWHGPQRREGRQQAAAPAWRAPKPR
jgi:peptidoglycan/LPS O-acetylase OafA/YrhL